MTATPIDSFLAVATRLRPALAGGRTGGANILCLDTCFGACSVALVGQFQRADPARPATHEPPATFELYEERRTGHAEALPPMLARILTDARLTPADLDLIVATHGPGTFTGVRAGVAAARGLALALAIPAVGVSSLATMAGVAIRQLDRDARLGALLMVAMPAGRDHLYLEAFGVGGLEERVTDGPVLITADAAMRIAQPLPIVAVGAGAPELAAAGRRAGRMVRVQLEGLLPRALAALAALLAQGALPPGPVRPLYLRAPDAKPPADMPPGHGT